jgi:hypothetical protein
MKKISLFLLVCSAGFISFAQDQPQLTTPMSTQTRFGIKGGVNLATLEIDDESTPNMNTNMKTSFHGSVFVNIPLSSSFRFQPELMFSSQGTKSSARTSTDPNLAGINEYDFRYLAVPLMFQWMSAGGFFVELGPQFSYLTKANGDRLNSNSVELKESEYVKKIDFAGDAGIGYLSRIGLGLNARYVHGFTNVWDNDKSPGTSSDAKYKNRVVQIGLIYHFGAGK